MAKLKVKAGLSYILFDEQFNYVAGGYDPVNSASAGGLKSHFLQNITVPKNGYVYIYCSNESNIDVWFDNLELIHTRGQLLEETHYYPFGLTMAGISSKAAGTLQNKEKTFQGQRFDDDLGLNWAQFKWRNHDVQIGRFIEIDPLSEKYVYNSTYAFSENKVTNHIELEGLEAVGLANAMRYREMAVRTGVNFSGSMTNGMINNPLVIQKQITKLEKGASTDDKGGVILHRTVSSNTSSPLESFEKRGVGTHFLVGKDGAIIQTASLDQKTSHLRESQLNDPNLSNANTIGIEVVGNYNAETKQWEAVTEDQAKSVAFVVNSLITTFGLTNRDIKNHEDVQPKTAGEGKTVYDAIVQYLNQRNNTPVTQK